MNTNPATAKEIYDIKGVLPKARPFKIQANPHSDTLVLLIHGFTSSPYVLRHLADFLAGYGWTIETMLLAGHGRDQKALEESSYHDWIGSAEEMLKDHISKYKRVFLIGHSMGANIAIDLASRHKKIKGVVALATLFFLKNDKLIRFFFAWYKFLGIRQWHKKWLSKPDVKALEEYGGRVNIPIKSLDNLYKFIDNRSKKILKKFDKPILIVHSRRDMVTDPRSSEYLFRNIAVFDKQMYILDKNSHDLLHNTRRDFLFARVANFIQSHC